jgi:hypothetical protein
MRAMNNTLTVIEYELKVSNLLNPPLQNGSLMRKLKKSLSICGSEMPFLAMNAQPYSAKVTCRFTMLKFRHNF